ncbi:glucose 1-dehydrogenase [Nocardioides bigeumensis]|uniref:Glucose 1-dehydrogenase n=1 Tax=Nocardioides bigeumensis TaxID=433657 RepID=A0ABN2YNF3_9ACTN
MRALTVEPGTPGSLRLDELPDPAPGDGELLVRGLAIGVCGTDKEITRGDYGWAPPGHQRLVLGHESLGRVEQAPLGSSFGRGDLVIGVVRRPDPEPCGACAVGEWDMCRNGRYTERGIKELPGFGSEWWTVPEQYAVRVDDALGLAGVLTEPTSVVAKAWEQVVRVGERAWFDPRRVLVTGAGPIGLLAAMIGVQRGLDVHVLDRVTDGVKPDLVRDLGATYHHTSVDQVVARARPDVVIEATGAGSVVLDTIAGTASYGIVCLTGVSPRGRTLSLDASGLNRTLVLENDAVIGSVNANLRHYQAAATALAAADSEWLHRLITTTVPLDDALSAFEGPGEDVKVVITLDEDLT